MFFEIFIYIQNSRTNNYCILIEILYEGEETIFM